MRLVLGYFIDLFSAKQIICAGIGNDGGHMLGIKAPVSQALVFPPRILRQAQDDRPVLLFVSHHKIITIQIAEKL